VTLDLRDVRGALVRRLVAGEERPPARRTPCGTAATSAGHARAGGLYFVAPDVDGQEDRARLVRLP
jgi:hypothetical protein